MGHSDTPWRNPPSLTEADRDRLDNLRTRQAARLDVTSDEHEYVWGFRHNRPDEEHRERLADISDFREYMHGKLAATGHKMNWTLSDPGVDYSPEWLGECGDCGAAASVGFAGSTVHKLGKDARAVACSGPETAWQNEMTAGLQRTRIAAAVGEFGQAVKDTHDRQWLAEQGLDAERGAG